MVEQRNWSDGLTEKAEILEVAENKRGGGSTSL